MSDRKTLLKVAKLSFVDGHNNHEIAALLKPDKRITAKSNVAWVQELIDEAGKWLLQRHERLAELEAEDTPERNLANGLREKFGLLDAVVVSQGQGPSRYVPLARRYARAAAVYFEELCDRAEERCETLNVAVCGGQGILDMVSALAERTRPSVHYYPAALLGRNTKFITHIGPETNATMAWTRSGKLPRNLFYGSVPPYPDQPHFTNEDKHDEAKQEVLATSRKLANEIDIAEILDDMNACINAAIAGLGLAGSDNHSGSGRGRGDFITGILKPLGIDPSRLTDEGAVGDIAYNVFDAEGKGRPDWNFFLTVGYGSDCPGLAFYRHLVERGRPVIVMAGMSKITVLCPALKARLFNVLITDACTATKLLVS